MTAKDMTLIQTLLRLNKPFLSPADLEKVLGQKRPALYVTLNRLVQHGVLVRLRQGVYQVALQTADPARIANQLVYPSYLSFESALSRYGILSQVPYALTFATTHRTQTMTLGETRVEFHRLKPALFFGYTVQAGLYVAEPEKAVLDQLYMIARGLSALDPADLDLSALDRSRLREYAARFPATVQAMVETHSARHAADDGSEPVHPHVVHPHRLREDGGLVGIAGPEAADGHVQKQEEGAVEDPRAGCRRVETAAG